MQIILTTVAIVLSKCVINVVTTTETAQNVVWLIVMMIAVAVIVAKFVKIVNAIVRICPKKNLMHNFLKVR